MKTKIEHCASLPGLNRRNFLRAVGMLAATVGLPPAWAAPASNPLFSQTYPDAHGTAFALKQWLGKPVVVNFWATWCPPCVKEMPDLNALASKYGDVHFLGLGVDTAANILKFGEKVSVSYPLLVMGHGGINVMKTLGNRTGGLPFTIVFDAHGEVVSTILGQVKPAELEQTLIDLMV